MAIKKIQININGEQLKKKLNIRDGKDGAKGQDGKNGLNGITPDTSIVAHEASQMVLEEIKPTIPTLSQLEEKIPELGEPIRDALELLPEDSKLKPEAIYNIVEFIENIAKKFGRNGATAIIARYLSQIGDVVITGISDGQVLKYQASTKTWINSSDLNAVTSVSNSDGSITVSPTTGDVVASLNTAHANTWTALQTFNGYPSIVVTGTLSPNVTGTYEYAGTYGGYPYWQKSGGNPVIFRAGGLGGFWYISTTGLAQYTGWYIYNNNLYYPPSSSAWLTQGGTSGTLTTLQGSIISVTGGGPASFTSGPVNFAAGLGVGGQPNNPFSVTGNSDFEGKVGINLANTTGIINYTPNVQLDVYGSKIATAIGTEEIFHIARGYNGATRYQQLASFNVGTYSTDNTGQYPHTRFDIGLKSTASGSITGDFIAATFNDDGTRGFGTTAPVAGIHLIRTSNLFRAGYDTSNYFKADVSSTGVTTFDAVGSGARFSFSDGITLPAGTATAGTSPIKFTSGTNLTTAETGAMEYNGTNLFFTRTGTTRESVFVGVSGATEPSQYTWVTPSTFIGATSDIVLGNPNSWASVVIGGTTYKIPLYT